MKKMMCKLVAVCVTLSMLLAIIPVGVFADTSSIIDEQFSTYAGGFGAAAGIGDAVGITGQYQIEHTPKSGLFGKATSDVSFNASTPYLTAANVSYFNINALEYNEPIPTFASGDILEFSFQVAKNDQLPFAVNIAADNLSMMNILVVNYLGNVTFAGQNVGTIPGYKFGKWYDYKIVFAFGDLSSGASLYIDGVPYAEDVTVINALLKQFTRFKIYTLNTSAGKVGVGNVIDTSVDSIVATKYSDGDYPDDVNIDLYSTDNRISFVQNTNGANAAVMLNDASLTAEDVLDAVDGNYYNAELLDENFNEYSGSAKDGYLKVTKADGRESWITVDALSGTYFEEDFNGDSHQFAMSMWSADREIITETFEGGIAGKDADDKAEILTSEGKSGLINKIGWDWEQNAYKNITSSVTFEMQLYRSNENFGFNAPIYYYMKDGGVKYANAPYVDVLANRWTKVAYHFDAENSKLITYVNGEEVSRIDATYDVVYRIIQRVNFAGSEDNPLPWVAGFDNFRYSFGSYDPSADVVNLSIKDGSNLTLNGDKIILGSVMTKEEFLNSLSFGNATAKIFDSSKFASTSMADEQNIVDEGQWLLLYSANGEVIKYYEIMAGLGAKFTTYFEEDFNGDTHAMRFTMWSPDMANVTETFVGGIGGKSADDKADILTSEGKANRQTKSIAWDWEQSEYKNVTTKVTFEMQLYRSNENFIFNSPYYYMTGASSANKYVPSVSILPGRWVKAAFHFDPDADKVTVYENGVQIYETSLADFDIAYRMFYNVDFYGSEENPLPWVAGFDNFRYSFGPYNPSADIINLSAKDGADVTLNGDKIILGSAMTKDEFLNSLSYGDATARIFDSSELASTSIADEQNKVDEGQWLLLYSANGEVIRYYEIMAEIGSKFSTYFEEKFEGDNPAIKFTMWSDDRENVAETYEGGIGGKSADDKANILKSEGKANRKQKSIGWDWEQNEYKNITSSATIEMQIYRSNDAFGYSTPYAYMVFEDGTDNYRQLTGGVADIGRWVKVAYHFDAEKNTVTLYKNGVKLLEKDVDAFNIAYRMKLGVNFVGSEDNPTPWVAGLDNFRYSFGPYDPSADVINLTAVDGKGVRVVDPPAGVSRVFITDAMSKEAFISSLSLGDATAKIFDSFDFASTAKADNQNIVDGGQWLLVYSANGEVIEYFEICIENSIGAISVSEDENKITASSEVTLNNAYSDYETVTLFVAAYSGNKLVGINMQEKTPVIGETTPFTAEIAKELGMNITSVKAFMWYDGIVPSGALYSSSEN